MRRILVHDRICAGCGGEIDAEKRSDAKFCSPACQQHKWRQDRPEIERQRGQRRYWDDLEKERKRHRLKSQRQRGPKPERTCGVCAVRIPDGMQRNARYCSTRCRALGGKRRRAGLPESLDRTCAECGSSIPQHRSSRAKFCSTKCNAAAAGRAARLRRYRRLRSVPSDRYTIMDLLERDGCCCHLCSEMINSELEWPDPGSPSVDHIVPLSKGGTDLLDNVAPAHMGCNWKKHARTEMAV